MRTLSALLNSLRGVSVQRDVILTVTGALAGWLISHVYYLRAVEDMRADAVERGRVDDLMFRAVAAVGDLKYNRDASGKIIGIAVELRAQAKGHVTATGDLRVVSPSGEVK